jgi:hypothetical protein
LKLGSLPRIRDAVFGFDIGVIADLRLTGFSGHGPDIRLLSAADYSR